MREFRFAVELRLAHAEERVVLIAKEPAVRAGATDAGIIHALAPAGITRHANRARHVARSHFEILTNGSDIGRVGGLRSQLIESAAAESRQNIERVVSVVAVRYRANQTRLVHDLRRVRHVLANSQARQRRADRLKLAADFDRRVRLHIQHVLLTRPTEQIEQDYGLRFA